MSAVKTKKEFSEMSYAELHRELKRMLGQAKRMTIWFNAVERVNLLPALMAMKEKVAQPGRREPDPTKPNWEDECRSLGITPEMVRQWKTRTQVETDIRHLLGEEPSKSGRHTPDPNARAMKHLADICKAVLTGDEMRAEQLAASFAERYGF